MAILSNPVSPPTPVDNRTLDQKKTKASRFLKNLAQTQYTQLCKMQKDGMGFLWDNPDGLTPQEVCDSVGTDGGLLMIAHGALTSCIISAATASNISPDIVLPDKAFTVNQDGTVTILNTPYVP